MKDSNKISVNKITTDDQTNLGTDITKTSEDKQPDVANTIDTENKETTGNPISVNLTKEEKPARKKTLNPGMKIETEEQSKPGLEEETIVVPKEIIAETKAEQEDPKAEKKQKKKIKIIKKNFKKAEEKVDKLKAKVKKGKKKDIKKSKLKGLKKRLEKAYDKLKISLKKLKKEKK
jgi:hypothetical protein